MKAVRVNQLKLEAKRVYTWLWWSPLLTIPTLIYLFFQNIGFSLGSRNLRVQALAQLESLNEVEVF